MKAKLFVLFGTICILASASFMCKKSTSRRQEKESDKGTPTITVKIKCCYPQYFNLDGFAGNFAYKNNSSAGWGASWNNEIKDNCYEAELENVPEYSPIIFTDISKIEIGIDKGPVKHISESIWTGDELDSQSILYEVPIQTWAAYDYHPESCSVNGYKVDVGDFFDRRGYPITGYKLL